MAFAKQEGGVRGRKYAVKCIEDNVLKAVSDQDERYGEKERRRLLGVLIFFDRVNGGGREMPGKRLPANQPSFSWRYVSIKQFRI